MSDSNGSLTGNSRKRQRPSIVCATCKKKKTKCDRNQPCSLCSKANIQCVYPNRPDGQARQTEESANLPYVMSAKTPLIFAKEKPTKQAKHTNNSASESNLSTNNRAYNTNNGSNNGNGVVNGVNGVNNGNGVNYANNGPNGPNGTSGPGVPNGTYVPNGPSGNHVPNVPIGQAQDGKIGPSGPNGPYPPNGPVGQAQDASVAPPSLSSDAVSFSLSELTRLKQRISQIESSLTGSKSDTMSVVSCSPENLLTDSNEASVSSVSVATSASNLPAMQQDSQNFKYLYQNQPQMNQVPSQQTYQTYHARPSYDPRNEHSSTGQETQQMPNQSYQNHSEPDTPGQNHMGRPYFSNPVKPIQLPPIILNPSNLPSIVNYRKRNSLAKSDLEHRSISSVSNSSINSISPSIHSETSPASNSDKVAMSPPDFNCLIGDLPYLNNDDGINFYEGYSAIHMKQEYKSISAGPFAWASIMKKDKGLHILWNSFTEKSTQEIMAMLNVDMNSSSQSFHKKALEDDDGDMVPYKKIKENKVMRKNSQTAKLNENALSLGLTYFDGQLGRELELIKRIKVILPKKKVIWKLIRRFFTWVYPFIPFLDETSFIGETTRLIGPESCEDDYITNLNVEKRIDLAHLGVLLIVLRLAYLSLFTNKASVNERNLNSTDPSPKAQEVKYLLLNPINIDTFAVAQDCLDQFQLLRRISFPVLQLTFFVRLYNVYAPEEGDIADCEPQTLNGVLIQMAYALGLNREPNKFTDVLNNPKQNNLRRKMWYFLVLWDMFYACTLGNPILTDNIYYDVEIPYYEPGNENISDHSLDKTVTDSFSSCAMALHQLRRVLNLVLAVNGKAKMADLCPLLAEFEVLIAQEFVSLEDSLKPLKEPGHSYVFTRNLTVKSYLFLKAFYMSIYFYFYLHYETKDVNLAFFYLKKLMLIAHVDVMPHYFDLLGENEIICDMVINPSLENFIYKANQINFSLIIKTNFIIQDMKSQPDHTHNFANNPSYNAYYLALCRSSSYLTRCAEVSIAAVSKLSNRYYQAWRITKCHTYILRTITSVEFYKENEPEARNLAPIRFTLEQIEQINSICRTTLTKLESRYSNSELTVDSEPKNQGEFYKMYSYLSNVRAKNDMPMSECLAKTCEKFSKTDDGFGLDFLESEDIDKLWLQMLSMKYDKQGNDFMMPQSQEGGEVNNFASQSGDPITWNNDLNPGITPSGYDRYGFDDEQSSLFSDFPFDKVFKPWLG